MRLMPECSALNGADDCFVVLSLREAHSLVHPSSQVDRIFCACQCATHHHTAHNVDDTSVATC